MIRKNLRKLYDKLTLKAYRTEVAANQQKQIQQTERLYEQLFLNNPVLVVNDVKIFLPLFYVDHIQKIIFASRDFYEKETLQYLKNNFNSFDNILDIGSNIGNHMLFYCSQLEAKKVYCFEPNKYNYTILSRNVELNNLQEIVTLHNMAVGEKSGRGVEKDFTMMNTGMNRIETGSATDSSEKNIEIVCLDDFNYTSIDFVKIDVEGSEIAVLKGAVKTLQRTRPVVMIETFENNQSAVDEIMQSYGYSKSATVEDYNSIYSPAN